MLLRFAKFSKSDCESVSRCWSFMRKFKKQVISEILAKLAYETGRHRKSPQICFGRKGEGKKFLDSFLSVIENNQ